MKRFEQDLKVAVRYCEDNIWEYKARLAMALSRIDRFRQPLELADPLLYDDILNALADCAQDCDIDEDNIDVEDVIFFC